MGLPGHRRTSSHKRRRASHFALKPMNLIACTNCANKIPYNTVCKFCGFLKGVQKITIKAVKKDGKSVKKEPKAKVAKKEVKVAKKENTKEKDLK